MLPGEVFDIIMDYFKFPNVLAFVAESRHLSLARPDEKEANEFLDEWNRLERFIRDPDILGSEVVIDQFKKCINHPQLKLLLFPSLWQYPALSKVKKDLLRICRQIREDMTLVSSYGRLPGKTVEEEKNPTKVQAHNTGKKGQSRISTMVNSSRRTSAGRKNNVS